MRTTRQHLSTVQYKVSKLSREGRGIELGEIDLEEDLMAPIGEAWLQCGSGAGTGREFVARAKNRIDEDKVLETEESEMEEEVSVEVEEVEGRDEEWLDWRENERARVERESSGTDEEEEDKTMVEGISEAIAAEIPRFAKRSKTRSFFAACAGVFRQSKVLSAQLVLESTGSQKVHTAQLVPAARHSETSKAKRERTGRTPGIVETRRFKKGEEGARV